MDSSSTFFGKCITVLIGVGLSWLTITNPDVDSLVAKLFQSEPTPSIDALYQRDSQDIPTSLPRVDLPSSGPIDASSPSFANRNRLFPAAQAHFSASAQRDAQPRSVDESQAVAMRTNATESTQIKAISVELEQLGASYLLLEKLPQEHGMQYRVRCDLADVNTDVKCCFEVIRSTPLVAMQEVLRVARQNAGLARTSPRQPDSRPDPIRAVATSS